MKTRRPCFRARGPGWERCARGFTLIELLVVIVLLAILATIAAPNLITLIENRRLVGAAEAVVAQFHFARSEAIKQSADTFVRVAIDANENERWVLALAGGRDPADNDRFNENCNPWRVAPECRLKLDTDAINVADATALAQRTVERRVVGSDFRGVNLAVLQPAANDLGVQFDFVRGVAQGLGPTGERRYGLTVGNNPRQLGVRVNVLGRAWICEPGGSRRYAAC